MFEGYSLMELAVLSALMLMLFFVMFAFMQILSVGVGLSREDRITVVFCGSKKSLVQGALMGQVLFPEAAAFEMVLRPLFLYNELHFVPGIILPHRLPKFWK